MKRTDQPRMTPSIREAVKSLELAGVAVVHAGDRRFTIAPGVEAVPAAEALTTGVLAALAHQNQK